MQIHLSLYYLLSAGTLGIPCAVDDDCVDINMECHDSDSLCRCRHMFQYDYIIPMCVPGSNLYNISFAIGNNV